MTKFRIAPNNMMFFGKSIFSPDGITAIILMIIGYLKIISNFMPKSADGITPMFHQIPESLPLIGGMTLDNTIFTAATAYFIFTLLRGLFFMIFTDVQLDIEKQELVVREFRGSFATNTILLTQVYDCDIHATIFQGMLGSGNLIVTTIDSMSYIIPWVIKPEDARQIIIKHAGGRKMRTVGVL